MNHLQFKIQIKGITNPPVWRRVLVPASFTFAQFHQVIQRAFGWENAHLYSFSPSGYGSFPVIEASSSSSIGGAKSLNAEKTKLYKELLREKQTYTYIYDFGDDWIHQITLEKKVSDEQITTPQILAGKGTCPPEDCGGPWGYEHLKEVLNDPKDPEHEEMKDWLGLEPDEEWNLDDFSLRREQLLTFNDRSNF